MKTAVVTARAKINLTLDVVARRPDGYHDLRMIMQSVDLSDTLRITRKDGSGVAISSNVPYLPKDEGNLAVRAAQRFLQRTGCAGAVDIVLEKRIPTAAGLAGGSADAAATLRGLNALFDEPLSPEELAALGLEIGSDVPFCLLGGTALAEGRGERLTPLPFVGALDAVLVKPSYGISTPHIFSRVQVRRITEHPDTEGILKAIRAGQTSGVLRRLFNVLEPIAVSEHPDLRELRRSLTDLGAAAALMSGSGPTTYGVFSDPALADAAAKTLSGTSAQVIRTRFAPAASPADIVMQD